jgi:hypothetical protein
MVKKLIEQSFALEFRSLASDIIYGKTQTLLLTTQGNQATGQFHRNRNSSSDRKTPR